MKAGTTSLYHYLRPHPQVYMAPIKELDFFVEEANWRRGFKWYVKHFEGAGPQARAVGEASTAYSKYPSVSGVPDRIAAHLPDVRLIYVVRDPIERIRSHYEHRVAVGAERNPLGQAALQNPIYLECSLYASQIDQYLRCFPRDQLLIITSEGLLHDRMATMRTVYEFLNVEPSYVSETLNQEFYKTGDRAMFAPAAWWLRHRLKKYFPGSKRAKEVVDSVLPRLTGRVLRHPRTDRSVTRVHVSDALRAQLADRLKNDVRRLSTYMDQGFDGWGII
jgi:hypothetical protein